ncbi:hypothetical protein NB693_21440 [Pantoea ananatis]|uniref:hypothetical protein n=1 Tax=Pantoea ananas TaxID=553 RepID=UPI002220A84E|nr:hypothetical protein [Pantoea ananatis]
MDVLRSSRASAAGAVQPPQLSLTGSVTHAPGGCHLTYAHLRAHGVQCRWWTTWPSCCATACSTCCRRNQALWKAVDADGGMPFPIWRDGFIGDADLAQAQQAYAQLSPTPARSHFDAVPLKRFHELQIPRSWLYATDDVALPPGEYGWHPRLSARLGGYRLVSLPGSHEVCFSAPALLAEKILLAGRD